ncbi:MAG: GHKL domain-containing protein [Clostridia bacterium]|nr:GHKL domain-containing protein [Clostridia bacterium]
MNSEIAPNIDEMGQYLTTKKDKSIHGLGLKSIFRVIKKYDGNYMMKYLDEDEEFRCVIQFPLRHLRKEGRIP